MAKGFLKKIEKTIMHIMTIGTEKDEKSFIDFIPLQDIKIAKIAVVIVNILMFFIFGNAFLKNELSAAVIHDAIIIPKRATSVLIAFNTKPFGERERKNRYIKKNRKAQ